MESGVPTDDGILNKHGIWYIVDMNQRMESGAYPVATMAQSISKSSREIIRCKSCLTKES